MKETSKEITLGSLFDGAGGFPYVGSLAGIKTIWTSEIEPFPIRVTTKRMPSVKHYGDVSTLDGAKLEPVDIITFGSPCQDMSIAGKREGLGGSRSSLFYEAIRIIKEMRKATNERKPEFIVWENVPGAFSSNHGEDFRCVIESICRIKDENVSVPKPEKWNHAGLVLGDGYSVAWRVLDAQYWGVPQRRKRIYLVADFRGERAGEILFESEGVSGNIEESGKTRESVTSDVGSGIEETGRVASTITASYGTKWNGNAGAYNGENFVIQKRYKNSEEGTDTLRVQEHSPITLYQNHAQDGRYKGPLSTADTVVARYETGGNNQPLVVAVQGSMIGRKDGNGPQGSGIHEDVSFTLNTIDRHAVAFSKEPGYIVRRLTPTECARLQGFPDDWCDDLGTENPTEEEMAFWQDVFETHRRLVSHATKPKTDNQIKKWLKSPHSDSAEYKMWGNSIAIPCALYVLNGLSKMIKNN